MDLEVAAGLTADLAAVVDGDVRAHPLEDLEQPRAARVEVDAVDVDLGTGDERRGDHERRGGGEVAGDLDLAERERSAGDTVTLVARTTTCAPAAASIRSVWSRVGAGSTTVVSPSAKSPARRMHDFTWALATGSA